MVANIGAIIIIITTTVAQSSNLSWNKADSGGRQWSTALAFGGSGKETLEQLVVPLIGRAADKKVDHFDRSKSVTREFGMAKFRSLMIAFSRLLL